jgi:hypothetical protein
MASAFTLLRRFTSDAALLDSDDLAVAAPLAPLTAEELLASFPLTTLFELLRQATLEGNNSNVRAYVTLFKALFVMHSHRCHTRSGSASPAIFIEAVCIAACGRARQHPRLLLVHHGRFNTS